MCVHDRCCCCCCCCCCVTCFAFRSVRRPLQPPQTPPPQPPKFKPPPQLETPLVSSTLNFWMAVIGHARSLMCGHRHLSCHDDRLRLTVRSTKLSSNQRPDNSKLSNSNQRLSGLSHRCDSHVNRIVLSCRLFLLGVGELKKLSSSNNVS